MKDELANLSAPSAAKRLIGCELLRTIGDEEIRVRIVETEAYDESDAASHSFNGRTARTEAMFYTAGYAYVYFTYGMHYCFNVVVGKQGIGAAVLIRAVEPVSGIDTLLRNRPVNGYANTNGPAKLCQALQIDNSFNQHDLDGPPLVLRAAKPLDPRFITVTTRIGISKAKETSWRFYETNNPYVSRT